MSPDTPDMTRRKQIERAVEFRKQTVADAVESLSFWKDRLARYKGSAERAAEDVARWEKNLAEAEADLAAHEANLAAYREKHKAELAEIEKENE